MLQINGIDYVEFYVGNASQAAHFYSFAFGFTPVARATLETGEQERTSYALQQNEITLILTSALSPESCVAEHVKLHGDSVKDIAFSVVDARGAFEETVRRGARPVMEPTVYEHEEGQIVRRRWRRKDTVHSFIRRQGRNRQFSRLPGGPKPSQVIPAALSAIDHIALCVRLDAKHWFNFHRRFRLSPFSSGRHCYRKHRDGSASYKTRQVVKFPIMEPAASKARSQIEEYLDFHHGPGARTSLCFPATSSKPCALCAGTYPSFTSRRLLWHSKDV